MNATGAAAGGQDGGHRIQVLGGTAAAVIDLAGGPAYGGHDPRATQVLWPVRVRGRLLLAHTSDLRDESAPILLERELQPGAGRSADARCPGCVAKGDFGELGPDTVLVLQHQDGCRQFAGLMAKAGQR